MSGGSCQPLCWSRDFFPTRIAERNGFSTMLTTEQSSADVFEPRSTARLVQCGLEFVAPMRQKDGLRPSRASEVGVPIRGSGGLAELDDGQLAVAADVARDELEPTAHALDSCS